MPDQANQLRRLAAQAGAPPLPRQVGPLALVVSGGRPGVGATTLATQLAASLAQEALRVVLIDADLYRADVASRCQLTGPFGIGDVLAGRKTIHEALQRGPAGIQVLAGTASAEVRSNLSDRTMQRLLRQLKTLGPHADWLLIDAGNQPSDLAARLCTFADRVTLVTTPDAVAVMDSYALIKTMLSLSATRPLLELVVNETTGAATAADVHRRIDQSCRRFLGLSVTLAGDIPHDPGLAPSLGKPRPAASGPLVKAVSELAERLVGQQLGSKLRMAA